MKRIVSLLAVVVLAAACASGDDGGPGPIDRIDGPATVDPDLGGDNGSGGGSEQGG